MSEKADPTSQPLRNRLLCFDLKSLFILIFCFAVLVLLTPFLNWASLATLSVLVVALVLLEPETRHVLAALILVSLVPFCWLVTTGNPGNSYHSAWLSMWPTLPGFLPSRLVVDLVGGLSQSVQLAFAAAFTLLFLALGTAIGRFNRMLFWLTVSFALALSVINSLIQYVQFYGLFRA